MTTVEVGDACVILHDQRSASGDVVEQFLVVSGNVLLCIVGANPKDDGSEPAQVFRCKLLSGNKSDINANLFENSRNIVSGAHDVADLQASGHSHVHDAHALYGGLVVIESVEVGARHLAVT